MKSKLLESGLRFVRKSDVRKGVIQVFSCWRKIHVIPYNKTSRLSLKAKSIASWCHRYPIFWRDVPLYHKIYSLSASQISNIIQCDNYVATRMPLPLFKKASDLYVN